jgi:hypothetical protein
MSRCFENMNFVTDNISHSNKSDRTTGLSAVRSSIYRMFACYNNNNNNNNKIIINLYKNNTLIIHQKM